MDSQHPLALPPYMSPADFPSPFPGRARSSEICRDFNNRAGYCPRGHSCPFLHVFETHDPRFTYPLFAADPYMSGGDPFMRKKKPCRDFNSPSGCPRGGSCRFPHVKERESKRRKFVDVSAGEKVDEVNIFTIAFKLIFFLAYRFVKTSTILTGCVREARVAPSNT